MPALASKGPVTNHLTVANLQMVNKINKWRLIVPQNFASIGDVASSSTWGDKDEPEPDFIETHCHWIECDKEFDSPDHLVKVRKYKVAEI